MACNKPLTAYRSDKDGAVFFYEKNNTTQIQLACGQCMGCKLKKRLDWAIRMQHEAQIAEEASFLTLTYREENYPTKGDLIYEHIQLLNKRIRETLTRDYAKTIAGPLYRFPLTYYAAGEYGNKDGRPHWHIALFGTAFRHDRYKWKKSQTGFDTYRSPTLEKLWTMGDSNIAEFNLETAGYIAGYVTKKLNGKHNDYQYSSTDEITGEYTLLKREFAHMSLKRPIGKGWLDRYWKEIKGGTVILQNRELPIPRYYLKWLKKHQPEHYNNYLWNTEERIYEHKEDYTWQRMETKDTYLNTIQRNRGK